ncbi:MAG: ABC transporter substrate-binding protein [Syntrophobacterales bacterium]|jgi:branched-chain amino acid transport system substrate-binding protein
MKDNSTVKLLFISFLLAILLIPVNPSSAQTEKKGSAEGGSGVVIGVPLPLSGDRETLGLMMKNSCEMAKETINKEGGINGRQLEIIYGDDQNKVSVGREVVEKLVRDSKAVMLLGGVTSNPTYAMAKVAQKLDVPFLVSTASVDKLTQKGWNNIFRLNPPASEYTRGLEDFWLKNIKPKSMAIIHENGMYGTNTAFRMLEFCKDSFIELRAMFDYDKWYGADEAHFKPMLEELTEEPPDVIFMVSYLKDAVALVKEIQKSNLKALLCGAAGGFTQVEFIKRAGDAANHLVTATLWSERALYPGAREYFDRYVKLFASQPDYHGAEAYSAVLVAADALRRAESLRPAHIRAALEQTNMMTPFGPVNFYSYKGFERQNSVRTMVLQIIDGKFETIWPPELASARFVPPGR